MSDAKDTLVPSGATGAWCLRCGWAPCRCEKKAPPALMPRQRLLLELAEGAVAVLNPNELSLVDEVSVAAFQFRAAALALVAAVRDREARG